MRDHKGRIRPGHTLNPGGVSERVREARRLMAEELLPEATRVLGEMLRGSDPDDRQFAVKEVLAYTLAKPKQTLKVEAGAGADLEDVPKEHLDELVAEHVASDPKLLEAVQRRAAQGQPPPTPEQP